VLTGIYQTIATLAVLSTFYLVDSVFIRRYDRQRQAQGSGRSWDYTLLILLAVSFIAVQPVLLPQLSFSTGAAWGLLVQIAGLALVGAAMALHLWARFHLRQFYAERVEVQPEHALIDSGPYAYVRHPVFTSFFMFVGGLLAINPSLPLLLLAAYTGWDFSRAARQEEALLSQELPGYADYITRTGRFFPDPRRIPSGNR
jgi:protein-S-isoprenylcysteine O-methyltransferase Ste14